MTNPRTTSFRVDWNAARTAPANLDQHPGREETAGASEPDALARLNAATAKFFPNASASRVPVLLPFDTPALLRDEAAGAAGGDDNKYLTAFRIPTFFYPGPTGYDAFLLQPQDASGFNLTFARRVDLQISASSLIYELDGPPPDQGSPVPELEPEFPGIRRVILESQLRYIFTRFGVPYFVSIACFDGPRGSRRLSCREADQVALRFIKALNIVGGAPQDEPGEGRAGRDQAARCGVSRLHLYCTRRHSARHRHARAKRKAAGHDGLFQNSFSDGACSGLHQLAIVSRSGDCDVTGRIALGGHGRDAAYRCRVNDVPLFNDETRNSCYPWRDNFCGHRYYSVTQCPAGLGHQGEDIRPSSCKLRNEGADRCEPYQDQVVAVRDGTAWRETADEALYLIADAADEHVRFSAICRSTGACSTSPV